MSHILLSAAVPAAYVPQVRAEIAPVLYPGAPLPELIEPLWPLGDPQTVPPTHYGCCAAPIPAGGEMDSAVDTLVASVPGCHAARVDPEAWDVARDWLGWLAGPGIGLEPRRPPAVG